jgi:SAM-dependent methyltransferase
MIKCRWCGSWDISQLWKFQDAPYGDLFREDKSSAKSEMRYSFALSTCNNCDILQLNEKTDVLGLYDNYLYQSGITIGLNNYYIDVAKEILDLRLGLPTSNVIDLGSNDGSFLQYFSKLGYNVLGIEPSKLPARAARNLGIETINEYFNKSLSEHLLERFPHGVDIISANYTLANVPDVRDFMEGIVGLLSETGMVSIITGYHPDQFSVGMWDYIGHDHLLYFSIRNLSQIFAELGLEIYYACRSEYKGGSIHVIGGRKIKSLEKSRLGYILQREEWIWSSNEIGVANLMERTALAKKKTKELLENSSQVHLGIGASISTSYLVNEFGIADNLSFLVDDDKMKIGKFSPHYAIEVVSFDSLKVKENENAIILAWQHTNVLLRRLKENGFTGNVLIPLPRPRILTV